MGKVKLFFLPSSMCLFVEFSLPSLEGPTARLRDRPMKQEISCRGRNSNITQKAGRWSRGWTPVPKNRLDKVSSQASFLLIFFFLFFSSERGGSNKRQAFPGSGQTPKGMCSFLPPTSIDRWAWSRTFPVSQTKVF